VSVSEILAHKGREIISVSSNAAVQNAADVLAQRKVGAVLVMDDQGEPVGILSERDIVRAVSKAGAEALNDTVEKYMTRAIQYCDLCDSVDDVMVRMTKGRFRHVPVNNEGRLIGVVSIGDVVKRKIELIEQDVEYLRQYIAG